MLNYKLPSWLPAILPLVLFLCIPAITKALHVPYLTAYPIGTLIVLIAEFVLWKLGMYPELKMDANHIPALLGLGVVLCGMWFLVDKYTPHFAFLGSREAYDPFETIHNPAALYSFLAIRFAGLVVAAPIAEELFYRSFLLRFLINPDDFKSVAIGKYELTGCIAATILMAVSHPEWLAAAIFSLTMNAVVYRTKSVGASVFTHAVTNLALGITVILTHNWVYW